MRTVKAISPLLCVLMFFTFATPLAEAACGVVDEMFFMPCEGIECEDEYFSLSAWRRGPAGHFIYETVSCTECFEEDNIVIGEQCISAKLETKDEPYWVEVASSKWPGNDAVIHVAEAKQVELFEFDTSSQCKVLAAHSSE